MGAKHASDSGSPADPLPPLGFFFSELGDDEDRPLTPAALAVVERRTRVAALYHKLKSMRAVAEEVGCSVGTVHADLHAVLEGYRRQAARDVAQLLADALQRLDHLAAEAEADLERSRGDQVDTTRTAAGGRRGTAVRRRRRHGDPRLHAVLLQCWTQRCKLLGLYAAAGGRQGDAPTVKLVAGVDPIDLV